MIDVVHSTGDKNEFPELKPGQVLHGRFVLHNVIGRGGQGMVYKLRHLEWNRDFALKLPRPKALETEKSKELFLKEAEAWIRLGVHPHIVRCWFVQPVGNIPGLFLDYMGAGSLESKIKSKAVQPGQWDRILQILIQVLEGLTHAHSKGMVHRDLKPDNLMIHDDGRVCLTDFGLVKLLDDSDLPETVFDGPMPANSWMTAGAMGTPRYAAPEQWMNPGAVNESTDLYSLGVIMFELLCGQRPFDPPNERSNSTTIIQRHLGSDPPHPLSIRDDIPPDLADLCLHMMAKTPSQRPQSAEEVLNALWGHLHSRGNVSHQRPASVPGGERPDFLNNAAVSLFSLGKAEKARELFLKGLMLEAGHPQCLFNLIQLDRREGKLRREEAIRRLERAKAFFGLALLYIEGGEGRLAAEILRRIPEEEKSGLLHRLEGDALMYAGEFDSAGKAYQKAAEQMPNDLPTKLRGEMAKNRTTEADGHVYFPPLGSRYSSRCQRPGAKISISPDAEMILAMDEAEVVGFCIHQNRVLQKANRPMYANPVLWSDARRSILLIQDKVAFEIWSLTNFQMVSRINGRVLARDNKLRRLLTVTEEGFVLLDRSRQKMTPLSFHPQIIPSKHALAAFGRDEARPGMLTQEGRLYAIGASPQISPLHWPLAIPDPEKMRDMCVGGDSVLFVYRSSLLRCFCLRQKRVSMELELGFMPNLLEADASGTLFVASSPQTHTVLDKDGKELTGGKGPMAVDPSGKRCLFWKEDRLRLYQLQPFQHLRTWKDSIAQPRQLQFSRDGRRAMSMDENGEYRVWDVDEESRVYERNLLMTPGQTYPQLIAGFEQYMGEFERALNLYEAKQFLESHLTLGRAREVTGFHQAEEALDLQWALCAELKHDGPEAIWERLYIPDTVSGQLSADSRHLLLAQERSLELFEISGPRIESKLKLEPGFRLFSAYLLRDEAKEGFIVAFGLDGELGYYRADNGEPKFLDKLKTGRIVSVRLHKDLALLQNSSGQAFPFRLGTAKMSEPFPLLERTLKQAFLLRDGQALLVTHQGHLLADFKSMKSVPGTPADVEHILGEVSFCADCRDSKLRLLGFTDGTFVVSHQKTKRPLFVMKEEKGAVNAAAINVETSLGVTVSAQGSMTFYDLSRGTVLDRFIAHADGIADLSITRDGRYLTTCSVGGQFRLWEMSWSLSDQLGSHEISWLPKSALKKLGKLFTRKKKSSAAD